MVFIMPRFTLYFLHPVTLPVVKDENWNSTSRALKMRNKKAAVGKWGLGEHLWHIRSWYSDSKSKKKRRLFCKNSFFFLPLPVDAVNKITCALWHALRLSSFKSSCKTVSISEKCLHRLESNLPKTSVSHISGTLQEHFIQQAQTPTAPPSYWPDTSILSTILPLSVSGTAELE